MKQPSINDGENESTVSELKLLSDRLNLAQIKVKRLGRLEAAIVDFFMEMMERTASLPKLECDASNIHTMEETNVARTKRREEYIKKAEGDPLALLNSLRAHLRIEFTTQEQQHHSMQQTIAHMTTQSHLQARENQNELMQWEQATETSQQQMYALVQQCRSAQMEHDRITKQYHRSLEMLNAELHGLRAGEDKRLQQLTQKQQEIEAWQNKHATIAREKKKLMEELAKSRMDNTPPIVPTHTNEDGSVISCTPAEQHKLRRALHDYEVRQRKLETINESLREEVIRLQQQVVTLKQAAHFQQLERAERELKKFKTMADELTKQSTACEAELLRTKGTLKERETKIQMMKEEYNKLFSALQKIKQTPSPVRRVHNPLNIPQLRGNGRFNRTKSAASLSLDISNESSHFGIDIEHLNGSKKETLHAHANDNPYVLEQYKTKIEQMGKEIEGLQTQLRKLLASEYRCKQENKTLKQERMQLLDACDRLRGELERAVIRTAKAMSQSQQPVFSSDVSGSRRKRPSGCPEDIDSTDNPPLDSAGSTVEDLKRLRERNQFLEERFRTETEDCNRMTTEVETPEDTPVPSRSEIHQSASINTSTLLSLQQLKRSARTVISRTRPHSATSLRSTVITKSLI